MRRDESAVAPPHNANPGRIDLGTRLEVVQGCIDVIDFHSAVVDGLMELLAVACAAAILRRNNHVPALHRLDDEREVVLIPVAVHATVHPDHSRVGTSAARVEWREDIRRNRHPIGSRAVGNLLVPHHADAARGKDAIRARFVGDMHRVVRNRMVLRPIADIQLDRTRGVHRNDLASLRGLCALLGSERERGKSGGDEQREDTHGRIGQGVNRRL